MTVSDLQLLRLVGKDSEAAANIVGYFFSSNTDNRRVPDRTVFKDREVGRPSAMSTRATPTSFSSLSRTASLDAIGSSTMSLTETPARWTHFKYFAPQKPAR